MDFKVKPGHDVYSGLMLFTIEKMLAEVRRIVGDEFIVYDKKIEVYFPKRALTPETFPLLTAIEEVQEVSVGYPEGQYWNDEEFTQKEIVIHFLGVWPERKRLNTLTKLPVQMATSTRTSI